MTALHTLNELPAAWQAACERDRRGQYQGADPGPERRVARLLAAFIGAGLFFLLLPGTVVGVWNLISIAQQHAPDAAGAAWIQAHGQAQLLGWVVTFILGISLYVLPKIRGRMLDRLGLAWTAWALWTAGALWRWWTGVHPGGAWRVGLVGSALLELAAVILVPVLIWSPRSAEAGAAGRKTPKAPQDLGSWLGIAGFGALTAAMLLNLGISAWVAANGAAPVYPAAANRTFLVIALWGFTVPLAWGYSTRFVTIFVGLEQPDHRAARRLAAGIAALVGCTLAGWFLAADILALLLTVEAVRALRVFRRSVRPPKLLGVCRHYPAFVRLSYAWLLVGAAAGVAAGLLPGHAGLGGASRHAITVGFLANLIFAIGPRILPSFLNSRELFSTRLMAATLWIVNAGCLLRVSSEAVAYSAGGTAWAVLPVSALLELTAVTLFVINMAFTMAQPMPAWFTPMGVSPEMPLYWYVTAYPRTRRLLMAAGLRSLRAARAVPRSLTLREAAAADGADLDHLLAELRVFFSRRQPRRAAR